VSAASAAHRAGLFGDMVVTAEKEQLIYQGRLAAAVGGRLR
jgi:hypothetical protein